MSCKSCGLLCLLIIVCKVWGGGQEYDENVQAGSLPKEYSTLSNLGELLASRNNIAGKLPEEYSALINLTNFSVAGNRFAVVQGIMPTQYSSLFNFTRLSIGDNNQITGNLPVEYSALSNLQQMSVENNKITGKLPVGYSTLSNLQELYLSYNLITGSYPMEFSVLSHLKKINLDNTGITDTCKMWQNSKNADYSYLVQISVEEGFYFCSGILIEKNWILTSYSCFQRITEYTYDILGRGLQDIKFLKNYQIQKQFLSSNCFDIEYTKIQIKPVTEKCGKYENNDQNSQQIFEPEFYVVYDEYEKQNVTIQNFRNLQNYSRTIHVNDFLLVKLRNNNENTQFQVPQVKLRKFNYNSKNNYEIYFKVEQKYQLEAKQKSFLSVGQTNVLSQSQNNNYPCLQSNFYNQICDQNPKICQKQIYICGKFNILDAGDDYSFQIHTGDPLVRKIDQNTNLYNSPDTEIFGIFSTDFVSQNFRSYNNYLSADLFSLQSGNFSFDSNGAIFVGFTDKIINWIENTTKQYKYNKCTDIQDIEFILEQGKHEQKNYDKIIIVSVLCGVGFLIAMVIILVVVRQRLLKKSREEFFEGAQGGVLHISEMQGLSEIISSEKQEIQFGFNQPPNWWADIKIPAGVREIPITHLKEVQPLGQGGFALVYEVKFSDDVRKNYNDLCDNHLAVKIVYKEYIQIKDQVEAIMQEINVMKDLNSQYIVQLIGASLQVRPSIVMELVPGGSLENLLYNEGFKSHQTSLQWKLKLMLNISKGIQYLHSKGIIHRDLKPHNILIQDKSDAKIKISDFGLSNITKTATSKITTRNCAGTLLYMSPEVCQGCQRITKKVDIWALGVIMQEIIRGVRPWSAQNERYIFYRIAQHRDPPDNGELPNGGYPQELFLLIRNCWSEASKRPTADEVVNKISNILCQETVATDITNQYSSSSSDSEQSLS